MTNNCFNCKYCYSEIIEGQKVFICDLKGELKHKTTFEPEWIDFRLVEKPELPCKYHKEK